MKKSRKQCNCLRDFVVFGRFIDIFGIQKLATGFSGTSQGSSEM